MSETIRWEWDANEPLAKAIRNATIEECAKVVDYWEDEYELRYLKHLSNAIRALKE